MAIWQFKFNILPRAGVISKHDTIPFKLERYQANFDQNIDILELEDLNYWEGVSMTPICSFFDERLTRVKSWDDEMTCYSGTGIVVEVWPDSIFVKVHASEYDISNIEGLLSILHANDFCLVIEESGELVEPSLGVFLNHYYKSRAYRFMHAGRDEVLEEIVFLNNKNH